VQYPGNFAERENRWEIPALLHARIWLGLEQHESEWRHMQREGEVAVYAETVSTTTNMLIYQRFFIFPKTLNSQYENNGNLKYLCTKLKIKSECCP